MFRTSLGIALVCLWATVLAGAQNASQPVSINDNSYLTSFANVSSRDCTANGRWCSCVDLWQSDCVCDGSDDVAYSIGKRKCSNCRDVCDEIWHSDQELSMFNVSCNVPLISQYSIQLFTRSMSAWSAEAMMSFKIVLEFLRDAVVLDFIYVGNLAGNEVTSAGGYPEVAGNIYQLCAMRYYPHYSRFMPFLYCMSKTRMNIPFNVQNCSKAHLMDYNLLKTCYNSGEGMAMLKESIKESMEYKITEPLPVIVMDGRPFRASYSRSPESFIYALCYIFKNPAKPFPWWVFGFMGAIVISLLVVLFVVKQWTTDSVTDILRSIFLLEPYGQEGAGNDVYDDDFFRMLAEIHGGQPNNNNDAADGGNQEQAGGDEQPAAEGRGGTAVPLEADVNTSDEEDGEESQQQADDESSLLLRDCRCETAIEPDDPST